MSDAILQTLGVGRRYPTAAGPVDALTDVNLTIGASEFIAISGPSGGGKSTLLRVLGLIDAPDSGVMKIAGVTIDQRVSDRERARLRREHYGFVFQAFNLIPELNALDNVALPLALRKRPRAERRERAAQALAEVGLADRAGHRPAQLSGGQQQRVAIARALVGKPDLLLADEPTGNLDQRSGAQVLDLLQAAHAQGTSLILVTHDPAYARLAQRQLTLIDGRLGDLAAIEAAE